MKDQLLQTISRLGEEHPEWRLHNLESHSDVDVGREPCITFWMGSLTQVWVTWLGEVISTDVIGQGLLAHQAMQERATLHPSVRAVNMVIVPRLNIQRPVILSKLVCITNDSAAVLTESMNHIAQRTGN